MGKSLAKLAPFVVLVACGVEPEPFEAGSPDALARGGEDVDDTGLGTDLAVGTAPAPVPVPPAPVEPLPNLQIPAATYTGGIVTCTSPAVRVSVTEANTGMGDVGTFNLALMQGSTVRTSMARPALTANTARVSTLTFLPYFGPCDCTGPLPPPITLTMSLLADRTNLIPETSETDNASPSFSFTYQACQ